jgi:hypothetical protein
MTLTTNAAERLTKILGLLGSDHEGERAAAAIKAHELIQRLGLTWGDVISAPEDWRALAKRCRDRADDLAEYEFDFIQNICRRCNPPTEKQIRWLNSIAKKLGFQS